MKNKKMRGTQNQKMTKDNEFAIWQKGLWNDFVHVGND